MKRLLLLTGVVLVSLVGALALRLYIRHRRPYAPPRPSNIAPNAVYIQGPEGRGLWEVCAVDSAGPECMIANVSGSILHQGRFVAYKGMAPSRIEDIVITQKSGDGWISLANGTYLIPAEHNEASKRYLDFMVGDAKHF